MTDPIDANDAKQSIDLQAGVADVLSLIEQEREKEIITRRFGLYDRRETLEQIGELLGITRERVRQLEKAILVRLKLAAEEGKTEAVSSIERVFVRTLSEMGRVARVQDLADLLYGRATNQQERSHVAFIATLAPGLTVVDENDNYHHAIAIADYGDEKKIRSHIDSIVKTIKEHGQPMSLDQLHDALSYEHPDHVRALASVSKQLAHLKDSWGLAKWPTVNPKNIRDKIYVILAENKKPLHFSDIAKAIKASSFNWRNWICGLLYN